MNSDCETNLDLLLESLDGPLSVPDQLRFEMHLAICPSCVETLREHVLLRSALQEIGTIDAERVGGRVAVLSEALVARFVTAMRDDRDGTSRDDPLGDGDSGSARIA